MKNLRIPMAMIAVCVASCATQPNRFADRPLHCPSAAVKYCHLQAATGTHIKTRRNCRCVSRQSVYLALGYGPRR